MHFFSCPFKGKDRIHLLLTELWPLISEAVSTQYLKNKLMDLTKLCICSYCIGIDKAYVGIVRHGSGSICS